MLRASGTRPARSIEDSDTNDSDPCTYSDTAAASTNAPTCVTASTSRHAHNSAFPRSTAHRVFHTDTVRHINAFRVDTSTSHSSSDTAAHNTGSSGHPRVPSVRSSGPDRHDTQHAHRSSCKPQERPGGVPGQPTEFGATHTSPRSHAKRSGALQVLQEYDTHRGGMHRSRRVHFSWEM